MNVVVGQSLGGRYTILSHLGSGGYGQTYLAQDQHLPGSPRCVVKQLQPRVQDEFNLQVARRLFNTEAQVLYELGSHDQIPRLFAHFEEDQEFYLVQECIEGADLSHEFTGEPWSEAQVVSLLQDLLQVLAFVHRKNVIHRDIKPRNLLRRQPDQKLVLIDFGAVKQISTQVFQPEVQSKPNQTVAVGTPGYMPLEQIDGNPKFCSDLYAVGMIAIQAFTGLDPSRNQLPLDPQTGEISWRNRAQVSPELGAIIDRMVRYHYKDRYQSAEVVIQDLQGLQSVRNLAKTAIGASNAEGAETQVARDSGIRPLPKSAQKVAVRPLYIGAGVVALVCGMALFKLLPWSQPSRPAAPTATIKSPASDPATKVPQLLAQGNQLKESGDYEKALATYNQVLQLQQNSLDAAWGKCDVLRRSQQYQEAIKACDRALQIQPQDARSWWGKGLALDGLKQYPDALDAYAKALAIDPNFSEAWSNQGATLHRLQKYEQALEAHDRALKLNANLPEVWNNRGATLNRLQRYQEALTSFDRALKLRSNYPEALNNRGIALANLQRFKDALAAYDKALQLQPDYQPAIANREQIQKLLND